MGAMANPSRGDKAHSPWATRLLFAHMNTVENLPVFAVVYGACLLVSADAPALMLAYVVLGARMVQSIVHVASRSPNAVRVRASMQFVQIICFAWLGVAAVLAIVNA